MDHEQADRLIAPSQGAHIVVDREFLPGDHGLMIPRTPDGRVLFAVPWHEKILLGTTDTLVERTEMEPIPTEEEIDFILETAREDLAKAPTREKIRSVVAGLSTVTAPKEDETI